VTWQSSEERILVSKLEKSVPADDSVMSPHSAHVEVLNQYFLRK